MLSLRKITRMLKGLLNMSLRQEELPSERLTVINLTTVDELPSPDRETAHKLLSLLSMRTQQSLKPGQRFQVIKRNRRGLFSRFKDKDIQGGLF